MRNIIVTLLGVIIFGTFSTQGQISSFESGSGSIIDVDVDAEGSGFMQTTTPVKTSIILPDDEDEEPEQLPEGSGLIGERKTVTERIEVDGSGQMELPVHCDANGWCYCLDEEGNEVPNTKRFGELMEFCSSFYQGPTSPPPSPSTTTKPTTTTTARMLPERMICGASGLYCWCADYDGNEMPETRLYMFGTRLSPNLKCPLPEATTAAAATTTTTSRTVTTSARDGDITIVEEITTKKPEQKTTPFIPPFAEDIYEKTEIVPMPDDEDDYDYGQGAGKGNRNGDDNGVDREEITPPGGALFTHPGILAAIIGGGVVALLSAMLLIMFIIYRMRKKDEGSYPLDPDSKPPRLNTYTRAPNKEFYA